MAGARPSGTVSLGDAMFNDDEEENSAGNCTKSFNLNFQFFCEIISMK